MAVPLNIRELDTVRYFPLAGFPIAMVSPVVPPLVQMSVPIVMEELTPSVAVPPPSERLIRPLIVTVPEPSAVLVVAISSPPPINVPPV